MKSFMRFDSRKHPGVRSWSRAAATSAIMLLGTIAALADDDDKPQPLDPHTKSIQLWTWGTAAVVVFICVTFYAVRYWQLSRMDASARPEDRD